MRDKKIKPCPFCGSRKVIVCRTNPDACWIRCHKCGADSPGDSQRDVAIRIWNKRPNVLGFAKIVEDND